MPYHRWERERIPWNFSEDISKSSPSLLRVYSYGPHYFLVPFYCAKHVSKEKYFNWKLDASKSRELSNHLLNLEAPTWGYFTTHQNNPFYIWIISANTSVHRFSLSFSLYVFLWIHWNNFGNPSKVDYTLYIQLLYLYSINYLYIQLENSCWSYLIYFERAPLNVQHNNHSKYGALLNNRVVEGTNLDYS